MKKKLLTVLLTISMAVSVVACGNGEGAGEVVSEKENGKEADLVEESTERDDSLLDISTKKEDAVNSITTIVKINGNEYDLSGDFKEVVGQMVKDGNCVINNFQKFYDENGEQVNEGTKTDDWCWAENMKTVSTNVDNADKMIKYKQYRLQSAELKWEMSLDITSDSDFTDVEALEGFVECYQEHGQRHIFRAVYMNGEMVDVEELEKEYEAFVDCIEEEGTAKAMEKYFPLSEYRAICGGVYSYSDVALRLYNVNTGNAEIKEYFDRNGYSFKNETLYALAFQKAGQALNNGEIDSFITIFFEDTEGRAGMGSIGMTYSEYYLE